MFHLIMFDSRVDAAERRKRRREETSEESDGEERERVTATDDGTRILKRRSGHAHVQHGDADAPCRHAQGNLMAVVFSLQLKIQILPSQSLITYF